MKKGFMAILAASAVYLFGKGSKAQAMVESSGDVFPYFDKLDEQAQGGWSPPDSAKPYLNEIGKAEAAQAIPHNLLARLIYQESRFRADIISGEVKSSAGAIGIAQIVPRWHPDVDPYDPVASIHYAAKYLRQLKNRFGSWKMALAAYNWGQGNLSRKGIQAAPLETRNYYTQILDDVAVV